MDDGGDWPHPTRELIDVLGAGGVGPLTVARDPDRWRRVSDLVVAQAAVAGAVAPPASSEAAEAALRALCAVSRCLWEEDRFVDAQWLLLKSLSLAEAWGRAAAPIVGDIHRHLERLYDAEGERYQQWAATLGTAMDEIRLDDAAVRPGASAGRETVTFTSGALRGAYEVALRAHQLAKLLADDERFEDATTLYERALALRSQLLDTGSSDLARTAHNLALLYERAGRSEEAHSLWDRVGSVLGSPPDNRKAGMARG